MITEYNGVITVNAKNARKISAGYLKSTQVFAYSNMLLYNKNGYYTLLEAELNNDFYSLREDIETFAFATYACETVAAVTTEGEDGKTLLSFLLNTLFICGKPYSNSALRCFADFYRSLNTASSAANPWRA